MEKYLISKTEFIEMLEKHDRHYRMSDDSSVYRSGRYEENRINKAIQVQPELQKIYDDWKNK